MPVKISIFHECTKVTSIQAGQNKTITYTVGAPTLLVSVPAFTLTPAKSCSLSYKLLFANNTLVPTAYFVKLQSNVLQISTPSDSSQVVVSGTYLFKV